jgi:hypothetical protein
MQLLVVVMLAGLLVVGPARGLPAGAPPSASAGPVVAVAGPSVALLSFRRVLPAGGASSSAAAAAAAPFRAATPVSGRVFHASILRPMRPCLLTGVADFCARG